MKIISIQRIGRSGVIQYIDDDGKARAESFAASMSDAEVKAKIGTGKADELTALRTQAKELGIKGAATMKLETLKARIAELDGDKDEEKPDPDLGYEGGGE